MGSTSRFASVPTSFRTPVDHDDLHSPALPPELEPIPSCGPSSTTISEPVMKVEASGGQEQ